eukprot:8430985-Pyramimonas_sp.AAC.1
MGVSVMRTSQRYIRSYSGKVDLAVRASEAMLSTSNGHTLGAFHSRKYAHSRARKAPSGRRNA